jgi:hypothetical protein
MPSFSYKKKFCTNLGIYNIPLPNKKSRAKNSKKKLKEMENDYSQHWQEI